MIHNFVNRMIQPRRIKKKLNLEMGIAEFRRSTLILSRQFFTNSQRAIGWLERLEAEKKTVWPKDAYFCKDLLI